MSAGAVAAMIGLSTEFEAGDTLEVLERWVGYEGHGHDFGHVVKSAEAAIAKVPGWAGSVQPEASAQVWTERPPSR